MIFTYMYVRDAHTHGHARTCLPSLLPELLSPNPVTHTVQKVIVVLILVPQGPLSPNTVASWCPEAGELENQEMRSRGIEKGPLLCDSGPFGVITKAGPLTPGCLFPGHLEIGGWSGRSRCCHFCWAFPLGKIFLIYSIVLPGKAVVCVCVCAHMYVHIVYVAICWASQNHRRVASYLLNIPEIPLVTTFALILIKPHCFVLPILESAYLHSACW